MSIAVSAVIVASRALRAALLLFAAAHGAAGVLVLYGAVNFSWPIPVALACLLGAVLAARAAALPRNTRRIDISGSGDIVLTVQQDVRPNGADCAPLKLMPGTTLWPGLLLLLLRDQEAMLTVLVLLPDSVSPPAFRSLAVACRAIAGGGEAISKT
jgi:hypothetical protein